MSDVRRMAELVEGLPTISAKIRALHAEGFKRGDIARFLGKRYQHVRNVLVQELANKEGQVSSGQTLPENKLPERIDLQLGPGGRIVIPAAFRASMQVTEGDRLMARLVDGELRLITPKMAVRRAQKMVRDLIPGDDSLAGELIADRRREVEREMEDG